MLQKKRSTLFCQCSREIVDGKAAERHFVESLDQQVHLVKSIDKVRPEYMILSDEIRKPQNETKEEGMEERQRQLLLNFLSSSMSVEQTSVKTKVPMEYVRKLAEEMQK
ncbi:hypothetical protein [Acidaminococcus massiliensis]|uniref:hypothetical protein n=1 Tax=Acidaminococcus massiliensis TaxID=1852375 RepID=UPI0023F45C19|nr:hypothetical protein [Acidaminococcus massiliensis]